MTTNRPLASNISSQKLSKIDIFSQIPRHNQMDILKKLDFKQFVRFKKCAQETVEITKNFSHRFPFQVGDFFPQRHSFTFFRSVREHGLDCLLEEPVRLEADTIRFSEPMSDAEFQYFQEFCQKTKFVTTALFLGSRMNVEPSFVDDLINLLNPVELSISSSSPYILGLNELAKLKKVYFKLKESRESDLLLIKNPHITLYYLAIGASIVNEFLKQWMDAEREIEHLSLWMSGDTSKMFENLNPFSHLRLSMIEERGYSERLYSLKRNDGKKIFIEMYKHSHRGQWEIVVEKESGIKEIVFRNNFV